MVRALLSVVAYLFATFATQALSHFVVHAEHYRAIPYLRAKPILPLGLAAALIQGTILACLYSRRPRGHPLWRPLSFAWLAGAFLVSYLALAEAAKYSVPAVGPWVAVEIASGAVQFTAYGLLLWGIDRILPGQPTSANALTPPR